MERLSTIQRINWNDGSNCFDTSSFDETAVEGRLNRAEMNEIIAELERSNYYQKEFIPLLCWCIPFLCALMYFTYYRWYRTKKISLFWKRFLVFLSIMMMIVLPTFLFFIARKQANNYKKKRVSELKKVLRRLQQNALKDRGVELRMDEQGTCIVVDYCKENSSLVMQPLFLHNRSPLSHN